MTTIAWDGKTLAGDRATTSGKTKGMTLKVFRCGQDLLGTCGRCDHGAALVAWYRAGAQLDKYPSGAGDEASLIVVRPDKTLWEYGATAHPFQITDDFAAWGTGDAAAKVAMACGKTAAEACALAGRFVEGCGGGVDEISLDSNP